MPAGQHQRGFEVGACPGPVVPLEQQRAAPTEPGERLQLRFSWQLTGTPHRQLTGTRRRGRCHRLANGWGGERLGHRPQHPQIRGVLAGPGPPRLA